MNLLTFNDYRKAIKELVKARKLLEPGFGFHVLAEAARIQRPYLSKCMKGTANLSSDQMFLIARVLKLNEEEHKFLQLLLEYDRTAVADRRTLLEEEIRNLSEKSRDTASHLSAKPLPQAEENPVGIADYYLDPMVQIVHVALSIERFSKNPGSLGKVLGMTQAQIFAILAILEKLKLIEAGEQGIITKEPSLHLPKTSPLYRAWRNQIKLLSIQKLNEVSGTDCYSFSTVFSGDEQARKLIHDRFLEFLKFCEKTVKSAPAKQVFQMSFDLFAWTDRK